MYDKAAFNKPELGVRENSTVACGFKPIKIHYSDYPNVFINTINQVCFSH